jgi:hypothetical protein
MQRQFEKTRIGANPSAKPSLREHLVCTRLSHGWRAAFAQSHEQAHSFQHVLSIRIEIYPRDIFRRRLLSCWWRSSLASDVRFWHKADMLNALTNVRFWRQSGHCEEKNSRPHTNRARNDICAAQDSVASRKQNGSRRHSTVRPTGTQPSEMGSSSWP